jgi:4-hydroxyacetophenone monooxygenase
VIATSTQRAAIASGRLEPALEAANIPCLVAVLCQLTGDEKWTRAPYRPTRTRGMDDHDSGGLPPEVQAQIRAATARAVRDWAAGVPPVLPAPSGEELLTLLELCMGEPIPAEYAAMTAEHMGFRPTELPEVHESAKKAGFRVIVIGAGVSGLTAAKHFQDAGIDHVVFEREDHVGGTWAANRYPGAGVDTPSYLYSFSFFRRAWTTHFGKRWELEAYLEDMADHFELRPSIRLSTEVLSAVWEEDMQVWTVMTRGADGTVCEHTAQAVVTAVGQLNKPHVPDLPGLDRFHGPAFHSAVWSDDTDVTGKDVHIIGTGASAQQIMPAIADTAGRVTVYQRSPQWIAPNANYFRQVPTDVHWLMEFVPYYHAWYRFRLAWTNNDRVHASLQIDPEWEHGHRSLNAVNDGHREFFTNYLLSQLEGRPDLVEKTLPTYPPFGKRMLLDNGWFTALKRDDVELVTRGVTALTETGVVDDQGVERPADVVVFATGFQVGEPLSPIDFRGRDGKSLAEEWADGDPRAYLGITAPDFPNLFFMYGPNTNLGHGGSFIFLAESQIGYITRVLCTMVEQGIGAISPLPAVHERYNLALDRAHSAMVWSHKGMNTWYRNAKGRVITNMPWRVVDYWRMTRDVDLADYDARPVRSEAYAPT